MDIPAFNETIYTNDIEILAINRPNSPKDENDSSIISLPSDSFDANNSIIRQGIDKAIEVLDNSSEWESDYENSDKKNVTGTILADINVYVEVRSGAENRSGSIEKQLKKLGANVLPKFLNEVTHVVFKEGRKSTWDRAVKRNVKLVSVLWIESCKLERCRVEEEKFPALPLQASKQKQSPFFAKKSVKKTKCMQPKDFERHFSDSAKKIESILSRIDARKSLGSTPKETDVMKKMFFAKNQLSVPSDFKKLTTSTPSVSKSKENGAGLSCSTSKSNNCSLFTSKTVPAKCVKFAKPKNNLKNHAIKSLTNGQSHKSDMDVLACRLQELSAEDNPADISGITLIDDDCEESEGQQDDVIEMSVNVKPTKEPYQSKINMSDINTQLFNRLTATADINSPIHKSAHLESILKPSTDILSQTKRLSFIKLSEANSSPEFLCQVMKTPKSKKICSSNTKRTIERSPAAISKKKQKLAARSPNMLAKAECMSGKLEKILKPRESIFDFKPLKSEDKTNKAKNHHRSCSYKAKYDVGVRLPSIVATSLSSSDRDILTSTVKAFGGYRISKDVSQNTSHVICGERRRTLTILKAIVHGSWVVSIQWVIKSIEAQKWIEEGPYEVSDYFPAVQTSRMNREKSSGGYSPDLFSTIGPIFINPSVSLNHSELQNLVISCQGQVTGCHQKAALSVGRYFKEIPSVTEKWIFDSITEFKMMDFGDYSLSMSV